MKTPLYYCRIRACSLLRRLAPLWAACSLAAAESTTSYNIPAGMAENTLAVFAAQSGMEVLFATESARGVRTNEVKGNLAVNEAVKQMLFRTPLDVVHDKGNRVLRIVRIPLPNDRRAAQTAASDRPENQSPGAPENFPEATKPMKRKTPIAALLGLLLLPSTPANAASAGTAANPASPVGVVEGRVFNPASGEYLNNAEVRVQGTALHAVTASDGRYRIANVPAGSVNLDVSYTGYERVTASVQVGSGETATRDFDLKSTLRPGQNDVVQLGRFTVSGDREGTAKAIMEQRSAMTIKNVVAADTFGDIIKEGNVGEVLQFMSGMNIIYSGDVPSTVSMSGMNEKYGALLVDGVRTSGATRAPALASTSAYTTDTIEVNKTNAADMDADAPAGSINMRSKSAFQRKGRYFAWEAYTIYNSHHPLTLGKMAGPNDGESHPLRPSLVLDYSDVYLDGKLGVVVNLSETNSTSGSGFLNHTYDTAPTASRPSPIAVRTLQYGQGSILLKRQGGGLNIDYKFNPNLTLSLRGQAYFEDARNNNRTFQLIATRASMTADSDELVMIANPTTNNVSRMALGGSTTHRSRHNHSFAPQLRYESKKLNVDATFAYTRIGEYFRNRRTGDDRDDEFVSVAMQLFGVGWRATRTDPSRTDYHIEQTSGPSLTDIDNWTAKSLANNIVRNPTEPVTKHIIGQINATYTTDWSTPTFFKAGLKTAEGSFFNTSGNYSYTYVGATGNRLTADLPVSAAYFDPHTGGNLFATGHLFPHVDRHALGVVQREHPEYFIPNPADLTSANNLFPNRSAEERINSGYLMANSRFQRLMVQGGVRYEDTKSTGRSYERGVLKERAGNYDDVFFSGAVRYRFTENRMVIASFSQSIQRANLNSMSSVLSINDNSMTGSLPNPDLKPEHGHNYSIRFEQYFEPVGTFSIGAVRFDVTDLHRSRPGIPAEAIGLGDDYPGYTFTALDNVGDFDNTGIEFAYSQQLTFLPAILRGLGVFANYSQYSRSDPELAYRSAPKLASGGITFRHGRLTFSARGAWASEMLQNADTYRRSSLFIGTTFSFRMTDRTYLTLTGRNITNQANIQYLRTNRNYINSFEIQGASWIMGVKGVF